MHIRLCKNQVELGNFQDLQTKMHFCNLASETPKANRSVRLRSGRRHIDCMCVDCMHVVVVQTQLVQAVGQTGSVLLTQSPVVHSFICTAVLRRTLSPLSLHLASHTLNAGGETDILR